jgi:hypothetical protein
MKMLLLMLGVGICCAQPQRGPYVSKFRLERAGGPLYATVAGSEEKIADAALGAWLIDDGKQVAYSSADGVGGFENEGQALRIWDLSTGKTTKILAESFEIMRVETARSIRGKAALLVTMEDGGLGASHVAVVDPGRGEVWVRHGARFGAKQKGAVSVEWYRDADWALLQEKQIVKPYRIRRYDLDALLARPVAIPTPRPQVSPKKQ